MLYHDDRRDRLRISEPPAFLKLQACVGSLQNRRDCTTLEKGSSASELAMSYSDTD